MSVTVGPFPVLGSFRLVPGGGGRREEEERAPPTPGKSERRDIYVVFMKK